MIGLRYMAQLDFKKGDYSGPDPIRSGMNEKGMRLFLERRIQSLGNLKHEKD